MSRNPVVIVAGVALAGAVAVLAGAPAHAAAPTEATASRPFSVLCSSGHRATLTLPVPGSFLPGTIDGGSAYLIPYRFDYRWTDADGHVVSRSQAQGASGPVPRSAVTCRLAPVAFPDGTSFSFTVTAVERSAR